MLEQIKAEIISGYCDICSKEKIKVLHLEGFYDFCICKQCAAEILLKFKIEEM